MRVSDQLQFSAVLLRFHASDKHSVYGYVDPRTLDKKKKFLPVPVIELLVQFYARPAYSVITIPTEAPRLMKLAIRGPYRSFATRVSQLKIWHF